MFPALKNLQVIYSINPRFLQLIVESAPLLRFIELKYMEGLRVLDLSHSGVVALDISTCFEEIDVISSPSLILRKN